MSQVKFNKEYNQLKNEHAESSQMPCGSDLEVIILNPEILFPEVADLIEKRKAVEKEAEEIKDQLQVLRLNNQNKVDDSEVERIGQNRKVQMAQASSENDLKQIEEEYWKTVQEQEEQDGDDWNAEEWKKWQEETGEEETEEETQEDECQEEEDKEQEEQIKTQKKTRSGSGATRIDFAELYIGAG